MDPVINILGKGGRVSIMKAVLLVGHGSRKQTSNQQFIQFAEAVAAKCNAPLFRYAFLELATPSILAEIKVCVEKGAKEITVFPLLLLTAGHAKVDIPNQLASAQKIYPNVVFRYEKPLGIQEAIFSILEKRLAEKQYQRKNNALVIFVGRGSYDQKQICEFEKVRFSLKNKLKTEAVQSSYLVGGHISFKCAVEKAKRTNYEQIFILPYLLFRGVLLEQMEDFIVAQKDDRFVICNQIGADEALIDLVSNLINKVSAYRKVI